MLSKIIIIEEENWFVARDITTDIASQGKAMNEALSNLKEVLELYYEE